MDCGSSVTPHAYVYKFLKENFSETIAGLVYLEQLDVAKVAESVTENLTDILKKHVGGKRKLSQDNGTGSIVKKAKVVVVATPVSSVKTTAKPAAAKPTAKSVSRESSSTESSDDEHATPANKKVPTPIVNGSAKAAVAKTTPNSAVKSTPAQSDNGKATKGNASAKATSKSSSSESSEEDEQQPKLNGSAKSNGSENRNETERFRRVTIDKTKLPTSLQDNSFRSKHDPWGEKAYHDFSGVTGKGFRHEKTKKKRGSYRGGQIDTTVRAIRFDD